MNLLIKFASLAASILVSSTVLAQAPAAAPSGSTGLCKDGTYTSNGTKKGACSGHKGVKDWFDASAAAAPTAATPAPASKTTAASPAAPTRTASPPMAQAAGGGAGQVWVNTASKVYHCTGTRYYGKTKQGEYMTESAAKAAGDRPDHGKACG